MKREVDMTPTFNQIDSHANMHMIVNPTLATNYLT